MNNDKLIEIKEKIENMSKIHQIEVLNILMQNKDITLNENTNGIFVNLSDLNIKILDKLSKYIAYVIKQESQLDIIEQKKSLLENTYFKE